MGFDLRELARWGGKPVGYFKFVRGTTVWAYTTADRELVLDGVTYTPAAIKRSAIKQGAERKKLAITVTLPRDLAVVDNWRPMMPRDRIALTIYAKHHGETDHVVDWIGRVRGPKFNGPTVELTCEPTMSTARRAGHVRRWQRGCGQALYACGVSKAAHELPVAAMTEVDSVTFTATEFLALPSGRLAGGFIEYARASDGVTEYRTIMSHSGDTIEIDFPLYDMPSGNACSAYPGCRQTTDDCDGYFNNLPNYDGCPWLPQRNPHDGNPVW